MTARSIYRSAPTAARTTALVFGGLWFGLLYLAQIASGAWWTATAQQPAVPPVKVGGIAPQYTSRALTPVPNGQAITRAFYTPDLNSGYIPQGVAVVGDRLFVSAYDHDAAERNKTACRIFEVSRIDGRVIGRLDVPQPCKHAGGLAKGSQNTLILADTRTIFVIDLAATQTATLGEIRRTIKLGGDVRGSFAAGDGKRVWLGTYAREGSPKLYGFPLSILGDPAITELKAERAVGTIDLPLRAQGAAFDPQNALWVSTSGAREGRLMKLDVTTGKPALDFPMAPGLEDLSFDAEGALWTLSEAGSLRWQTWDTHLPIVMRIDVQKLQNNQ